MSMARLSAGAGYRYLLRHTAAGDAERPGSTPLVEYYAATGYPPGRWLWCGLAGLEPGKKHRQVRPHPFASNSRKRQA